MNILVCDDDREIVNAIEIYLKNEGYDVFKAYDGVEAMETVEREEIHLILMDVMMPKLDGMRATMKIREEKNIPIIILSAKSEDYDKITGLNAGADDYITKPFNPLELIARVKSQLRRYTSLGSLEQKTGIFETGGLMIDDERKTVQLDGKNIAVTPIEYGILRLLTEHAGRVFSMDQIYEAVWHEPAYNPENTVAVHIRRIREKIEIDPKNPKYLKVVWELDTKSRKYNKPLFLVLFVVCMLSFLVSIVSFLGAMRVNSLTEYQELWAGSAAADTGDVFFSSLPAISAEQTAVFAHQLKIWLGIGICSMCVTAVSLVYLGSTVGERDENGKIILNRFDRIFTEIQFAAIAGLLIGGGSVFINKTYDFIGLLGYRKWIGDRQFFFTDMYVSLALTVLLGLLITGLGLALILSCIRKLKAEALFEHSLCARIYQIAFCSGSLMRKVVLIAICICCLSATIFLAPVILIVILVFAPKAVSKYENIKRGIREVNAGNLDYKIPADGDDELDQLARGINRITEATSIAVENEVKNQRMKTDLISNVSHDLKTPLTSMVTYIDLLKTEGLDSDNAPGYLEILESKTNQLRKLTEDLFEAAKASSGSIPVRMGRVDLLSLVNQGLGEMNQRMEESGLQVIVSSEKDKYWVNADGQLMWRVVENLLGNVIKYSQENTRVYIEIRETASAPGLPGTVRLEIKNISKYSLNINPEELTERFKRGDVSRTTEGSGLGLAIAKDLMKLMAGRMEIDIDGDLFKARVFLEAAGAEEAE